MSLARALHNISGTTSVDSTIVGIAWHSARSLTKGTDEKSGQNNGGESGIRTLGTRMGTTVFETAPINRSGNSPLRNSTFILEEICQDQSAILGKNAPGKLWMMIETFV